MQQASRGRALGHRNKIAPLENSSNSYEGRLVPNEFDRTRPACEGGAGRSVEGHRLQPRPGQRGFTWTVLLDLGWLGLLVWSVRSGHQSGSRPAHWQRCCQAQIAAKNHTGQPRRSASKDAGGFSASKLALALRRAFGRRAASGPLFSSNFLLRRVGLGLQELTANLYAPTLGRHGIAAAQ